MRNMLSVFSFEEKTVRESRSGSWFIEENFGPITLLIFSCVQLCHDLVINQDELMEAPPTPPRGLGFKAKREDF